MLWALPAYTKRPVKVSCYYVISFNCIISTYPSFASLHSRLYFNTILQKSKLRFRAPKSCLTGWISQSGCQAPVQFSDHLLMSWSQLHPPKCLSEAIDVFIYLFLQQIFIEGLLCAGFGAWGSSLILLHWTAEQREKKSQSERGPLLMAFPSCAMSLLVIKPLSLSWLTFFMPQSTVILQPSLFWQCKPSLPE